MNLDIVHDLVGDVFARLGRFIARHPIVFVLVPIIISCALMSGLYRIHFYKDYEALYIPRNARSFEERRIVEEMFPINRSIGFDMMRMTRLGQIGMVIITPKDNGSVLRKDIARRYVQIDNIVRKITLYSGKQKVTYKNVCAKTSKDHCFEDNLLSIARASRNIEKEHISYPYSINNITFEFFVSGASLGGVEVDERRHATFARAFRLTYFLDDSSKEKVVIARDWQKSFLKTINSLEFDEVDVLAFGTLSIEEEVHRISEHALPLVCIAGPVMVILYVVTCLMTDWVRSKPWLGICGFITAIMAVGSSFGLLLYCNVNFIDANAGVALVVIILEMHNTFIFMVEWRSTNPSHTVEKRMGDTYAQAGPVISLSCLAIGSCFILGCATPYYVIQLFAIYTIVCIIFTFIYCTTFFGGCLALSGQREDNKLHPITCLPLTSYAASEKRNILFRCCCTGGNHTKEFNSATKEPDNFCMTFFRDKMASLVKYTMAKIVIATIFAIYLIVAGWLYSRVKGGLDYSSVFPTGSYGSRFARSFYRYFADYPQRLQIIVNTTMDYTQPEVQKKINDIVKRFEETQYTDNAEMTESWLKYFNMFTDTFFGSVMLMSHNLSKKSDFFEALTKYYLRYEYAAVFVPDIKFNENRSDIIATRYLVQVTNMHSCQKEMEMVQHVRNIADSFEFPVHIHDIWFTIYDIFLGVRSTFIQFCLTSLSVTVVLFFVFAPSIPCALCVLISFFSIQLGTISYVSLWNVDFNIISAFSQMGCTIIPVIYLIQLPYAYHRSDGKRRIQQAFFFAGMPIFQNTLAITACVFIITFAPIPILTIFFRVFCVMMLLSVLHVFFVIPTILSIYESLFPQATMRRKRSLHRTSIRSSLKRSSIVSAFKASIRTNKGEPDEDTRPMSVDEENEEDSDVESGQLHTFSELNNNVFEFEDPNASDSNSS